MLPRHTIAPKVPYDASADDLLAALTALEPIYSAGVESDTNSVLPAWHVTLVSAEDYEPIFVDGYLLEGTHAAVTVSDSTRFGIWSTRSCRHRKSGRV